MRDCPSTSRSHSVAQGGLVPVASCEVIGHTQCYWRHMKMLIYWMLHTDFTGGMLLVKSCQLSCIHYNYLPMPFCSLQKKSHGNVLLEQVFYHLDILEKDYFGLQYTDHYNVNVSIMAILIQPNGNPVLKINSLVWFEIMKWFWNPASQQCPGIFGWDKFLQRSEFSLVLLLLYCCLIWPVCNSLSI